MIDITFDNIIFSLQNSGGISVVWYELLKRALNDRDFNPYFLDYDTDNFFRRKLLIPKSKKINLNDEMYRRLRIVDRYSNFNYPGAPALFHSSYYRINKFPGKINITTVHDFIYEKYAKYIPKKIHSLQKSFAINHSDFVICVSENTKKDLLYYYPSIKEEKIKVVYNGVDQAYHPLHNKSNEALKANIPFESGSFILYVGDRKSAYKNFNLVVEVCKIVSMPLVLIGGGHLDINEFKFLSSKLGSSNYKLLIGLNNEQLNILYNNAFCLLYPSSYEGFGIPIIEAQRAGCLVVTSYLSSIPEIAGANGAFFIRDLNKNGIANTILELRSNPNRNKDLVKSQAVSNSNRFSWEITFNRTKDIYLEALRNK